MKIINRYRHKYSLVIGKQMMKSKMKTISEDHLDGFVEIYNKKLDQM